MNLVAKWTVISAITVLVVSSPLLYVVIRSGAEDWMGLLIGLTVGIAHGLGILYSALAGRDFRP